MKRIRTLLRKIPVQVRLWLKWLLFVCCIIGLVLILTEINHRLIIRAEKSNEFYASWYGFRAFLAEGKNPYGTEMQARIRESAAEIDITLDEDVTFLKQPLYGIIVYLPFLFMKDFSVAYRWWLTLLEISAVFVAFLGVSFIKVNLRRNAIYLGVTIVLLSSSLPFLTGLTTGSSAILAFLILFASVKALQSGGDELTGVLLSLLTIFPVFGWISMIFILVWSVRQKRNKVLWWFLGTLILLGFAVALLETQWLLFFLRLWVRYFNAIEVGFLFTILDSVFPSTFLLPGFITGALFLLLLVEWLFARHKEFILFYWTFSLTLVLEAILTMNIELVNVVFAPITLFFMFVVWEDRWKQKGRIVGVILSLIVTGLPWFLHSTLGERGPIPSLLIVSVSVLILLFNLYWIRWWLTKNVLLWHSDAYSLEQSNKGMGDA